MSHHITSTAISLRHVTSHRSVVAICPVKGLSRSLSLSVSVLDSISLSLSLSMSMSICLSVCRRAAGYCDMQEWDLCRAGTGRGIDDVHVDVVSLMMLMMMLMMMLWH